MVDPSWSHHGYVDPLALPVLPLCCMRTYFGSAQVTATLYVVIWMRSTLLGVIIVISTLQHSHSMLGASRPILGRLR
eukprot:2919783-Pleurochrysis_carterae.AAC.1